MVVESCKIRILFKINFFSYSNFIQNQNLLKFEKNSKYFFEKFEILLRFEICSKSFSARIRKIQKMIGESCMTWSLVFELGYPLKETWLEPVHI
jgi:hypothetical protein